MERIPLIHPIYLDVPMLVSFAAAIQGGLSLESEVTAEKGTCNSTNAKASGKLGFSELFQRLFSASVSAEIGGEHASETRELRKESKAHTEASIAILLYHELKQCGGYILQPSDVGDLRAYAPGTLVEVAGAVEKNAVDAIIDYMDVIAILSGLAPSQISPQKVKGKNSNEGTRSQIEQMRQLLDRDRKRTPLSNIIVRCSEPKNLNVVATLRTANLRDLTLSELHKNTVRVVGKVTRIIPEGQSMSSFENYGMALFKPEYLNQQFDTINKDQNLSPQLNDVEVHGPAFQLLPLMIFV